MFRQWLYVALRYNSYNVICFHHRKTYGETFKTIQLFRTVSFTILRVLDCTIRAQQTCGSKSCRFDGNLNFKCLVMDALSQSLHALASDLYNWDRVQIVFFQDFKFFDIQEVLNGLFTLLLTH